MKVKIRIYGKGAEIAIEVIEGLEHVLGVNGYLYSPVKPIHASVVEELQIDCSVVGDMAKKPVLFENRIARL